MQLILEGRGKKWQETDRDCRLPKVGNAVDTSKLTARRVQADKRNIGNISMCVFVLSLELLVSSSKANVATRHGKSSCLRDR